MKKLAFGVLCMVIVVNNTHAFENTLSFGFSYQNITNLSGDFVQSAGGDTGWIGFSCNFLFFRDNSNIGLFINTNDLIAVYLTNENNLRSHGSNYYGLIIGPVFRRGISWKLTLFAEIGIDAYAQIIRAEFADNTVYNDDSLDLGIGGQIGLKLDITDVICIKFLLNGGYTFVNCIESTWQWSTKSKIALNPFIGVGFNWGRS